MCGGLQRRAANQAGGCVPGAPDRTITPLGALQPSASRCSWGSLPDLVLAQILRAACARGALPTAPRLACVCRGWAAAVASLPELWSSIDTARLPSKSASFARGLVPAASCAEAGLLKWAASGRLSGLRRLLLACGSEDAGAGDVDGGGGAAAASPSRGRHAQRGVPAPGAISAAALQSLAVSCTHICELNITGAPLFRAEVRTYTRWCC